MSLLDGKIWENRFQCVCWAFSPSCIHATLKFCPITHIPYEISIYIPFMASISFLRHAGADSYFFPSRHWVSLFVLGRSLIPEHLSCSVRWYFDSVWTYSKASLCLQFLSRFRFAQLILARSIPLPYPRSMFSYCCASLLDAIFHRFRSSLLIHQLFPLIQTTITSLKSQSTY